MRDKSDKCFKWILFSVGTIVLLIGLITFFLHLIVEKERYFDPNNLEAISLIVLGISLFFLPIRFYLIPLILSIVMLALAVFRGFTYQGMEVAFPLGTREYEYAQIAPHDIYLWVSFSVLALCGLLLFFMALSRRNLACIWVSGIFGAIVLGAEGVIIGAYIAEVPYHEYWDQIVTMNLTDASAFSLFAIASLIYTGHNLAMLYPTQYSIWLGVIIAIGCMGGTLSSWAAFNAREKSLVLVRLDEELLVFQESLKKDIQEYLTVVDRLGARWQSIPDIEEKGKWMQEDVEQFQAFYPFLMTLAIVDQKGNTQFKESDEPPILPFPRLLQMLRESASPSFMIGWEKDFKIPINSDIFMGKIFSYQGRFYFIAFQTFLNEKNEIMTLIALNDFTELLLFNIPEIVKRNDAFQLFLGDDVVASLNVDDTKFKESYSFSSTWDLYHVSFSTEIWPRSALSYALEPVAGYYHLAIGIVLSVVLGACIYLIRFNQKQKAQAEALNLEKTFFLANISHELRTPLHGILGSLSMFEQAGISSDQEKWLEILKQSSHSLLTLINELIDLSHIDLTGVEISIKALNLKELGSEIYSLFSESADEKQLTLLYTYEASLPEVFLLDGMRLKQILAHLVGNAIKFTDKGGVELAITGKKQRDEDYALEIIVKDTGVGIAKREKQIIFEKYKHINVRDAPGSGLGLGIVKRLVEAMHGQIFMQSEKDVGSEFRVALTAHALEKMA